MSFLTRTMPDGTRALYEWFGAMHTRVDILLRSSAYDYDYLRDTVGIMRQEICEIEKTGNRFDPTSEVSRLNALQAGVKHTLSPRLYDILTLCLRYNKQTEGLFDITVQSKGHSPQTIGGIHIDSNGTYSRDSENIMIDLSGFLKGYALDRVRPVLEERGITDALVNMGNSSIMAMGDVPGPVRNACLTTSGNDSPDRCHIVNPLTGEMIRGKRQVQVVTNSGAEGEAEATRRFISCCL